MQSDAAQSWHAFSAFATIGDPACPAGAFYCRALYLALTERSCNEQIEWLAWRPATPVSSQLASDYWSHGSGSATYGEWGLGDYKGDRFVSHAPAYPLRALRRHFWCVPCAYANFRVLPNEADARRNSRLSPLSCSHTEGLRPIFQIRADASNPQGQNLIPSIACNMEMQIPNTLEDVEILAAELLTLSTSAGKIDSEKASIARDLSLVLYRRFCITGDLEHLEEAIAQAREAVDMATQDPHFKQEASMHLANLCCRWYRRMKEDEESPLETLPFDVQSQALIELSTSIEQLSFALKHVPQDHHQSSGFQNYLARMLYDRARPTKNDRDFKDATCLAKSALELVVHSTSQQSDIQEFFIQTYRKILAYRHIHLGNLGEKEAMDLSYQQVLAVCSKLPSRFLSVYDDLKSQEHLDQKKRTIEMLERGDKIFYKKYFSDAGEFSDLEEGIAIYEDSIREHDLSDDTRRAWRFRRLSRCFCMRYLAKCSVEDLRKALEFGNDAKMLIPGDDPDRGDVLRELAEVRRYLFLCTGRVQNLHEAVELLEDAVSSRREGDIRDRPHNLRSLAIMRYERFQILNNEEDIRAAEERIEEAIQLASGDEDRLKAFLNTHADILLGRYLKTYKTDDLELATQKAIESKKLCAKDPLNFHQACSLLGILYKFKFERFPYDEHLRDALHYLRLAKESAPVGSEYHARTLMRLAVTMGGLYDQTGKNELLEEAIANARQAISSVPEQHYSVHGMKRNLGGLLFDRCKSKEKMAHADSDGAGVYASRLADLKEAIGYFEQSLAAGDSTRLNWGSEAFGLSFLLSYEAQLTGDSSQIPKALQLLLMSVENDSEAPLSRVSIASRALRYIWSDIEGVAELQNRLAKIAIDLLPYACSRELSRGDQQFAIRVVEGFAADSCSFSIKLGNVEEALQRVEYGRGLILGHLIDRKDNITDLREKHIDLANKYLDLRDRAFRPIVEERLSGNWESMVEDQRKAHLKLRRCEEEIRCQPGFENFQKPTSVEELQGSATHGPVVVVNVTSLGSDAIILTKSQLATIPLPQMTKDIPELFQGALGRYISGTRTSNTAIDGTEVFSFAETVGSNNSSTKNWPRLSRPIEKDDGGPSNTELLTWLWRSCVRPVISKLQELGVSPDSSGNLPRVWWIGSGAASSLPFHAAGDFEALRSLERDQHEALRKLSSTCLDWMTPSYAPTIKALKYARARADAADLGERPAVMVVTMPSTPGQSDLTGVLREKAAVQAAATGFQVNTLPDCPAAKVVLASLPGSSVVHFACHGMSDPVNLDESHILLQKSDGGKIVPDKLSVGQILDNKTPDGSGNWLVYLSACSTAQVKADKLGDESLHLASAFQVAGFAHAIGSLWSADDDICVEVARLFYEELSMYTGTERKVAVAHALRKAVIQIRNRHYDNPALWAPFIHFGA